MNIWIVIAGRIIALAIYAIIKGILDIRKLNGLIVQLGTRKNDASAIVFANHIAKAAIPNRP